MQEGRMECNVCAKTIVPIAPQNIGEGIVLDELVECYGRCGRRIEVVCATCKRLLEETKGRAFCRYYLGLKDPKASETYPGKSTSGEQEL